MQIKFCTNKHFYVKDIRLCISVFFISTCFNAKYIHHLLDNRQICVSLCFEVVRSILVLLELKSPF